MYKNFLENHSEYENIFVTDVRDVIFQDDIFARYKDYKNFLVYAEENQVIQNDQTYNSMWIKHLFGEEIYQELKDKVAICCGTVCGSNSEIKILFAAMIKILEHSSLWGDEQAAMNYLIHKNLLPIENLIGSDCQTGEIFTVGLVKDYKITDKNILRGDGEVPAIVHQYDRKSDMVELANKFYRVKDFKFDERFTDTNSLIEQMIYLANVKNFDDTMKIFVNYLLKADCNGYGDKILKLCEVIFKNISALDFETQILLVAIQKIIIAAFSVNADMQQVERIYNIFSAIKNNSNLINAQFENFVGQMLIHFANIAYQNNRADISLMYIDRISKLNLSPDKDFYLFQAKVYRETNHKEQALESYKKVLEL